MNAERAAEAGEATGWDTAYWCSAHQTAHTARSLIQDHNAAATPAPREPRYVSLDDAGPGFLRRNPDYQGEDIIESTAAPREDGWEELRREIEALLPTYPYTGATIRHTVLNDVVAIVDRLAAARGEPGLLGAITTYLALDDEMEDVKPEDEPTAAWDARVAAWRSSRDTLNAVLRAATATPTTPEPDPRRFRDYPDGHGDVYRADCDCDCHIPGEDMDPADCDHCTGMSEQERAATPEPDPEHIHPGEFNANCALCVGHYVPEPGDKA